MTKESRKFLSKQETRSSWIYVTTKPLVINSTLGPYEIVEKLSPVTFKVKWPARMTRIHSVFHASKHPIIIQRYQVRKNQRQNLSQLRDMKSGKLKKSSSHSLIASNFNTLSSGNIADLMKTHGNQPAFSQIPKKQFRNITRLIPKLSVLQTVVKQIKHLRYCKKALHFEQS